MNVPTANVILAFSKDVIDKLKADGSQYQSLVRDLNKETVEKGLLLSENFLVFNNTGNPNFISFEHTFNSKEGAKFTLTFIDPKREFEERFFDTSLKDNVAAYFDGEQSNLVNKDKNNTNTLNSISELQNEEVTQLVNDLKTTFGKRKFYIFYGIGNNLKEWAGPYKCELMGSNIDLQGSRKITLVFGPLSNNLLNEVNLNLLGLNSVCVGESKYLNLSGITSNESFYSPIKNLSQTDKAILDNNIINQFLEYTETYDKQLIAKLDLHSIVVDCIRNYIQKATGNNNVIVLLPDLNLICSNAIDDAKELSISRQERRESIQESIPSRSALVNTYFSKKIDEIHKVINFLKHLGNFMGLSLESPPYELSFFKTNYAQPWAEAVQYQNAEKFYESFLKAKFNFILKGFGRSVLPNHKKIIKSVIDSINKYSKSSYPINLRYVSESSIDLLDFWSEDPLCKAYLFGGYKNFIKDKGVIIVGDQALIKNYLYGFTDLNKSLENIQNLKLEKQTIIESGGDEEVIQDINTKINFTIPLHPLDRVILTNKKYNQKVRDLVIPEQLSEDQGWNSSFGPKTYIPSDDFGYVDSVFSKEQKELLEKNKIPVFRYNTKNPNILKLNLKAKNLYFSLLNLVFEKNIVRTALTGVGGELTEGFGNFKIATKAGIISYALAQGFSLTTPPDKLQEIKQNIAKKASSELFSEDFSAEDFADSVIALLTVLAQSDNKILVQIDQSLRGGPADALMDLIRQLYKFYIQLEIKTLPAFQLSKTLGGTIGSNCVVFAQDTPVVGVNYKDKKNITSFVSGIYNIIGFKHRITSDSCDSEFDLIKASPNTNLEESD